MHAADGLWRCPNLLGRSSEIKETKIILRFKAAVEPTGFESMFECQGKGTTRPGLQFYTNPSYTISDGLLHTGERLGSHSGKGSEAFGMLDSHLRKISRTEPDRSVRRSMLGHQGQANSSTPCAACKLLRRRCAQECPFSPYFSPHEPQKFACVHKIFGASNVSKMLMEVPESQRADAASSLVYEANARIRDPVYGCMGAISALQQQAQSLQAELHAVRQEIMRYRVHENSVAAVMASGYPSNPNDRTAISGNLSSQTTVSNEYGVPSPNSIASPDVKERYW